MWWWSHMYEEIFHMVDCMRLFPSQKLLSQKPHRHIPIYLLTDKNPFPLLWMWCRINDKEIDCRYKYIYRQSQRLLMNENGKFIILFFLVCLRVCIHNISYVRLNKHRKAMEKYSNSEFIWIAYDCILYVLNS